MTSEKKEYVMEVLKTSAEVAGIPGAGLVEKLINTSLQKLIKKRLSDFINKADIDEKFIEKVLENEEYSNCLYAAFETVRQTHSKIGLVAIALIYKDHWKDDNGYLIAAMRAFSQISDKTIYAFVSLYDGITEDESLELVVDRSSEGASFHPLYEEAVELIQRNFFIMASAMEPFKSAPIKGRKWDNTESYYRYCKEAIEIANVDPKNQIFKRSGTLSSQKLKDL